MSQKINASILGVTGYTGLELVRLLLGHPRVNLKHLVSYNHSGQKLSALWPHLKNVCDAALTALPPADVAETSDVVFLALPHYETQKIAKDMLKKTKIIDLSADFRLKDIDLYKKYYVHEHEFPEGIREFIYGLPEAYKKEIAAARNIANPGCFAITCQLALLPLMQMIEHASVFAITGSSGAGKNPKEETHHPVRNHNVASYKIGLHQHIPEIIQTLGISESQITFVPASGSFTRGIHLTAFLSLKKDLPQQRIVELYEKIYEKAPFVRLKERVQLAEVIGSNFCDIAVHVSHGKLIVQAAIDNLVKGASGNAIQNMNIMCGFDETEGLAELSPIFP